MSIYRLSHFISLYYILLYSHGPHLSTESVLILGPSHKYIIVVWIIYIYNVYFNHLIRVLVNYIIYLINVILILYSRLINSFNSINNKYWLYYIIIYNHGPHLGTESVLILGLWYWILLYYIYIKFPMARI